MLELIQSCENAVKSNTKDEVYGENILLLQNEIAAEQGLSGIRFNFLKEVAKNTFTQKIATDIKTWLEQTKKKYAAIYNEMIGKRDAWLSNFQSTEEGKKEYKKLTSENHNKKIEELVKNYNPLADYTYVENGRIYQSADPIYKDASTGSLIRAHLYAPNKFLFGTQVSTFWVNILILWMMSVVMFITLYFNALRKGLEGIGKLVKKRK